MAELDEIVVRITGDISGLESAIGSANSQLSSLGSGTGNSAVGEFNSIAAAADNVAVRVGQDWKKIGDGVDAVTKPLQVASVAVLGLGTASAMAAVSFEDNFASVKKTVDGTDEQLNQIKQDIIDMTTIGRNGHSAIPQTTAELTELAAAGGQLGIQTENIADFTETMAMLGSATNLYGEKGAATVARFMNVTNTSQDKIRNLGSAVVELGNNFATTEAEIADMALSMGATGNVVGISPQDILAYSTALSSLGVEAMAGGSAVSRIWMDIQSAVSSGGEDLATFAKVSGKSSKEFAKQWKDDASGAFQEFLKGLGESEDIVGTLSDLGFNNIRDIQALQRLAGEKGFELLTDAIERSNEAWKENTALQTEFEAKADTTASKIVVAKNNATEMARSFGEIMLPTIVDVTGGLSSMAQGIAQWDDGSKKALITSGAVVVGLGAVSKGAAGTIKTVGGVVEGVGKIKSALATGGTLAKFAPTLTAIGSAAGPAAIAVAGVGAAALITKAAYDSWYNTNYKFAAGFDEQTEKLISQREQWKTLNDLRWEYNDLSEKINSGAFEGEELENAQSRLDEIIKILKDEYKIDVDSEDIDKALAKAEQLAEINKTKSETQLKKQIDELTPSYEKAVQNLPLLKQQYAEAAEAAQKYTDAKDRLADIDNSLSYGEISEAEYVQKVSDTLKEAGINGRALSDFFKYLPDNTQAATAAMGLLDGTIRGLNLDELGQKIADYEENIDAYTQAIEGLADVNLDSFTDALKAGADGTKYLERIAEYTKAGILDADEYAKKAALVVSGQESVNSVFEQGEAAIGSYVSDYISKMQLFGATTEQTQAGIETLADAYTKFLDEAGKLPKNTHVEFTAEGEIVFVPNDKEVQDYKAPDKEADVNYSVNDSEVQDYTPPIKNGQVVYEAVMPNSLKSTNYGKFGVSVFKQATGTQNFPGGLAMVNDQKGISDPRELIIDRGRAFIPEGRDVVLPLSKGAKVYTAAETKRIMSGIPHYAEGKNNSDAFMAARDEWSHYTKTHAVTTADELQKWLEFQEKYKSNEKDIWDIEEQIFTLQQKITSELNKQSLAYIDDRAALSDWEEYSDSAIEAFGRIRDRNRAELDAGRITWDDYVDNVSAAGTKLYDGRIKQSRAWLDHEEKYNGLSAADYLAGIDRMRQYTQEYYNNGLISHRAYIEGLAKLDDDYLDKRREQIAELYDISKAYISDHTYFNDWSDNGDDPLEAYNRVKEQRDAELAAGELTLDEYNEYMTSLGSDMYAERREQSENWLEEQRKYFNMSAEDYAAGIDRMRKYTQEYYDNGLINRREYNEAMTELNHMLWDEAESAYEEMLSNQSKYISDMRDKFSKEEQALRDSWDVADRAADIADVREQLKLYEGAVTDRGQQKYKELQEQMKQLERDEELYNLQVANSAVIDQLEAEYATIEADKKTILAGIAKSTNIDIPAIVGTLTSNLDGFAGSITTLLQTLITTVDRKEFAGPTTNYNDNRVISLMEQAEMIKYIGELK